MAKPGPLDKEVDVCMTQIGEAIAALVEAAIAKAGEITRARCAAIARRDQYGGCDWLGPMDPDDGTRPCKLESRGGDCLCQERTDAGEAIALAIEALP